MALWKIGVGVPITNPGFKFGKRVYALLNGAWTSGTTLTYDNDTGTDEGHSNGLVKYLQQGDKILVGPSTYTNYEGATEVFTVYSGTGTQITVDAAPTVDFSDNDPITAICGGMPAGWTANDGDSIWCYPLTGQSAIGSTSLSDRGYKDRYRAFVRSGYNGAGRGLHYIFNDDDFIEDAYYRFGFFYQTQWSISTTLTSALRDSNGNFGSIETVTSSQTLSWTEFNSGAKAGPSSLGDWWDIYIALNNTEAGNSYFLADDVYVEHAMETDDASSGVYTFDDYPSAGSRSYSYIGGVGRKRLANNVQIVTDNTGGGDRTKKLMVKAGFNDVTKTLRENLQILLDW